MANKLFKKTLLKTSWSNYSQTIQDEEFVQDGYAYIVAADQGSITGFSVFRVEADDIDEDGSMVFNCGSLSTPNVDISVVIAKIEATNGNGEVINSAASINLVDSNVTENGIYYPDTGEAFKKVTVEVPQLDTSDANATAGDILLGKSGYVDGVKVNGAITSKSAEDYIPGTSDQVISSGQYLSGNQTVKGDADLVAANIKKGIDIFGVTGSYTSDANAAAGDILLNKTAYVNGAKVTGSIVSKSAETITPGTTDQIISLGQYLSGAQTIKGDANLVASNIKKDIVIFGVTGSLDTEFSIAKEEFVLSSSNWNNNQQTISDPFFILGDYTYLVDPDPSSYIDYTECGIYASNMSTSGYFTFNCQEVPDSSITVLVIRMEL